MPKYGLLIDYEFCTGCRACELACKQEHNRPDGERGIRTGPGHAKLSGIETRVGWDDRRILDGPGGDITIVVIAGDRSRCTLLILPGDGITR